MIYSVSRQESNFKMAPKVSIFGLREDILLVGLSVHPLEFLLLLLLTLRLFLLLFLLILLFLLLRPLLLLLQMIILRDWALASDHPEGPASCKLPSRVAGLLQKVIRIGQPLANDHLEGPASCK